MRTSIYFILLILSERGISQQISELTYLNRPHFQIITKNAAYLFDCSGGGFSSIKDLSGKEWIGYQPGEGKVPESAAADFRGLPNLVFRGDDNGAGHPGFDQCISEIIGDNKIRTQTKSGKWMWEWSFDNQGALLNIFKVDLTREYWFLYEGTPGGSYEPDQKYWGNNQDGIRYDAPPLKVDSLARGDWQWVFFGDVKTKRSLVIIHLTPDEFEDNFSYMGSTKAGVNAPDGMVVMGFGRSGSTPLMNGPNQFYLRFYEIGDDFKKINRVTQKTIRKYTDN